MGIGGAAVYSLVLMGVCELLQLGSCASRLLRWVGREILDGAALHGASLHGTPHALDPSSSSGSKSEPSVSE